MSTFFKEGIEFVLPGIFKAYPIVWAEQFLQDGTVYFTNIEVFRKDDNQERGDPLEGMSVTMRKGVRCTGDYAVPIFVWCATMETNPVIILKTWGDRDTVLQVTNTLNFAQRVRDAAVARKTDFISMHVGPVTYDKDEGSYRDYHWVEGVFQKNFRHNGQKEFRFALVGDGCLQGEEHVKLVLGDCRDIARIV
jgi:hypothetical protein